MVLTNAICNVISDYMESLNEYTAPLAGFVSEYDLAGEYVASINGTGTVNEVGSVSISAIVSVNVLLL